MKLSIIVITYRESKELLQACFDSVHASDFKDRELIIVDNGGSEATKILVQSYSNAIYLPNPENRGFAAAVNQGMKIAQGEYVLLLNPDTKFEKTVLGKMVAHLDRDRDIGIASCIIRYPDGSLQESIRRFPTLPDQLLILFKIPHFVKTKMVDRYMMREADPYKTQDVDSIMGAFMFIRREVIDAIGYFDERYFIWFEEVDYCKMASDARWKIRHYADVEITHHKGHTFSKIATLRKQRWIRESMRKYFRKHHGFLKTSVLWVLAPVFIVLARLTALVKPQ